MGHAFESFRVSEDLSPLAQGGVLLLFVCTVLLLVLEARAQERARALVFSTGVLAAALLCFAVLRPTRLLTSGNEVSGLAVALIDGSHRLGLPGDGEKTRAATAAFALKQLENEWEGVRLTKRTFDSGLIPKEQEGKRADSSSDVLQALREVSSGGEERPQAIVLFTDGRVTRPGEVTDDGFDDSVRSAALGIPVHTVALAQETPRDRSIRKVGFTGSAIAHQPLTLKLEIGCFPAETCAEVEVVVRELLEGQEPVELVRGTTSGTDGIAELDLDVTLERAGGRVIEVGLVSPEPDTVPENDRRILPIQVRRDRLRMLHVAGRPTYDVRALRMFLKSDESIDLISFFILRTMNDQVGASADDLALIPFPVDELFDQHLKSFDAVILQDIDAQSYGLDRYFPSIRSYVIEGGGLILVGGQTGFSSGGYAGSEVGEILPVELPMTGDLTTRAPFVPDYTTAGRAAPLLRALRTTLGEELPDMSGANILGRARPSAVVLWEHPTLGIPGQSGGEKMPVLALSEVGDGRTIAISVDSTHQLKFGAIGAATGGRAYADLWSGLLGWLMRDPRFEGAQTRLEGPCIAGRDQLIVVEPAPADDVEVTVTLEKLGTQVSDVRPLEKVDSSETGAPRYLARELGSGGYAARVQIGKAPPTRSVFACEEGGEAWADSRPDVPRLTRIAETTGGIAVRLDTLSSLPEPASTFVAARRKSSPLLPPWLWASFAALLMSVHWILRRAFGYA